MASPTSSQIQGKYNTFLRNIESSKLKPLDLAKEGARWYGKLLFLRDFTSKNEKIRLNWYPKRLGKQKARVKAKWIENGREVGMSDAMADVQRLCHASMGYNQILKNFRNTYSGVHYPDSMNVQECKRQIEAWEKNSKSRLDELRENMPQEWVNP